MTNKLALMGGGGGEHSHIARHGFRPTPWGSPSWRRGYNRRSAMERNNGRLDNSFNFETH